MALVVRVDLVALVEPVGKHHLVVLGSQVVQMDLVVLMDQEDHKVLEGQVGQKDHCHQVAPEDLGAQVVQTDLEDQMDQQNQGDLENLVVH